MGGVVAQNPDTVALWLTHRQGHLVGRARKNARQWVFDNAVSDSGGTLWRKAFAVAVEDSVTPLEVSADHRFVWALSNRGRDTMALVQLDLSDGRETVYHADPRVDLSQAFISRKTGKPLAVTLDPGEQEWKFFDVRMQALADKFKGPRTSRLDFISANRDENLLVLQVQDGSGGRHLLVDLATPIDRHGQELRHAPTVVLVHGGPWARDYSGGDLLPYFLANRGYAVLQVNYRGSSGYGKAFQAAARGEFAGKMHTDLLDGVDYLVQQGAADPAKAAIMGDKSPLYKADQVRGPLLILQGARDARVHLVLAQCLGGRSNGYDFFEMGSLIF